MVPVLSIVGKSDSGKTTLIEKLIPELKHRGYRVGTIKHDAHRFEMDHEGKDTYRHFHAGADTVLISSAEKMAMQKQYGMFTLNSPIDEDTAVLLATEYEVELDGQKVMVSKIGRATLANRKKAEEAATA